MGKKKYVKLLAKKGFKLNTKVYKKGKKALVLGCYRGKSEYVAKIFFPPSCSFEKYLMRTEIQALLFFRTLGSVGIDNSIGTVNLPFFPKYVDHKIHHKCHLMVMEKISGRTLLSYYREKMPLLFWKSLIYQLIVIIFILEDLFIIHHDFLDRNIILQPNSSKNATITVCYKNHIFNIPNAGFIVKAIDFQFTHQFTNKPAILCKYNMTTKSLEHKTYMGLSDKFHAGTDLNLIFGILSDFKYLPLNFKRTLKSLVLTNNYNKNNRRYSLLNGNVKTTAAVLLHKFETLF